MPASTKITKDIIFAKALEFSKTAGLDNLSARSLASAIGVSTQPIYSSYKSIDELKSDCYKVLKLEYIDKLLSNCNSDVDFFRSFTDSFIDLLFSDFKLFKTVFFSNDFAYNFDSFYDEILIRLSNRSIFGLNEMAYGIDNKKQKLIFREVLRYLIGLSWDLNAKDKDRDALKVDSFLCVKAIVSFLEIS